jgi:hypothetical protein
MPGIPLVPPALSPEMLQHVDALCDQFESALATGQALPLEGLLGQMDEFARPRLFHHLLDLEIRARQQAGRPLTVEEANQRFAGLGP